MIFLKIVVPLKRLSLCYYRYLGYTLHIFFVKYVIYIDKYIICLRHVNFLGRYDIFYAKLVSLKFDGCIVRGILN